MAKRFIRAARVRPSKTKPYHLQPNAPAAVPEPEPRNMMLMIFPAVLIVGVVGTVLVMFTLRGSGMGFLFPGFTMFGMVGLMAMNSGRFGRRQKRTWGERDKGRRLYMDDLDQKRDRNQEVSGRRFDEDREANALPRCLPKIIGGQSMWQRRPRDADFLDVRLGNGVQEADQGMFSWEDMNIPKGEEIEPVAGNALRRFMLVQTKIHGLGKVVNLRSQPGFALVGDNECVGGLARAMLCQIATYHSPAEVKIAIVSQSPRQWDWVKWLPHNRHDDLVDACGRRRMVFDTPDEIREALADDIHNRERWEQPPSVAGDEGFSRATSPLEVESPHASGDAMARLAGLVHWIIVDDSSGTAAQWDGITGQDGFLAVTFLRLAESRGTGVGFGDEQIFEVRN
ncbi:hypothetical protein C0J29_31840 (plasmid) [Mycobacterium paragordonae]|nr:hypothetical protein C0J29_31840 [Mycobacterium paragordonae]